MLKENEITVNLIQLWENMRHGTGASVHGFAVTD